MQEMQVTAGDEIVVTIKAPEELLPQAVTLTMRPETTAEFEQIVSMLGLDGFNFPNDAHYWDNPAYWRARDDEDHRVTVMVYPPPAKTAGVAPIVRQPHPFFGTYAERQRAVAS